MNQIQSLMGELQKEEQIRDQWIEKIKHIELMENEALKINFNSDVTIRQFKVYNSRSVVFKKVFERDEKIYVNTRKCNSGYSLIDMLYRDFSKITNIEIVEIKPSGITFEKMLSKRYDSFVWSNLETKDNSEFRNRPYYRLYDIRKIFSENIIELIERAFRNKTDFHHSQSGGKDTINTNRRDYSVELKLGEDGIFRAWFSSEYAGCGNGDYYLLLSPTTAVFSETD